MKFFLLFCAFFISVHDTRGQMFGGDWMPNLFDNLNRMNHGIRESMHRMNHDLHHNLRNMNEEIQRAAQSAGDGGQGFGGPGIIVTSNGGHSTSITSISGTDEHGHSYTRTTEEKTIGNILHHTETVYYPHSRKTKVFRYTLDLTDPNARPVIIPNNQ